MIYLLLISLITSLLSAAAANSAPLPNLAIRSDEINAATTSGGNMRGPALAVLANDDLLLGGGKTGGELFLYNLENKKLTKLGAVIA